MLKVRPLGRANICAVVVTYFPKAGLVENLDAIARQVDKLVVVDNGSIGESSDLINVAAQRSGATVIRLGTNRGVAAALNAGREFAHAHGYDWLATFDQDSLVTADMIESMVRAYTSYPRPDEIAIITPCHVDRRLGYTIKGEGSEGTGAGWRLIFSTMTSGNLVDLCAASAVGGFDDSLFIDYVDHEFCLRLRQYGYRVLEAKDARLLHSVGAMERRLFLFKRVIVTNHPIIRRYYIGRNRLLVWRQYWRQEPMWVIKDIRRFICESFYVLLYEEQAAAKMRMLSQGLHDGIMGIRGPFNVDG